MIDLSVRLYIITAPSGTGKTSLINALIHQIKDLKLSVSHTTRPPRFGEVDGEHYYFVGKDQFEQMIRTGQFLEHAIVYEHYYGTSRCSILKQLNQGYDIILEIDWQGAAQIRHIFAQTKSIFIFPPSLSVLYDRLKKRKQDNSEVIQHRMRAAISEIKHYQKFDYVVVNKCFKKALANLVHIIRSDRLRMERQKKTLSSLVDNLLQKQ